MSWTAKWGLVVSITISCHVARDRALRPHLDMARGGGTATPRRCRQPTARTPSSKRNVWHWEFRSIPGRRRGDRVEVTVVEGDPATVEIGDYTVEVYSQAHCGESDLRPRCLDDLNPLEDLGHAPVEQSRRHGRPAQYTDSPQPIDPAERNCPRVHSAGSRCDSVTAMATGTKSIPMMKMG